MKKLLAPLYSVYHMLWAIGSTIWYGFPSRKLYVIGVTGTKGKSSTVEMINQILEAAGHKTAVAGTIRFKINEASEPNMFKMSMPGRGFLQQFLTKAVKSNCDYAIIEMTSEGSKQARHFGIAMNALVFTNLAPEHIESHGSYEKYRAAKLAFARALARSPKPNKVFIGNGDDSEIENFLRAVGNSAKKIIFKLKDWDNLARLSGGGLPQPINLPLPGTFNKYNALAAIKLAEHLKIKFPIIKQALENFNEIKGRVQRIYASTKGLRAKQNFEVIVDYAHTPDSLKQLLETFKDSRKICVFGSTGGGRDVWKRKVLGEILDQHCAEAIISTDDPYDEDPQQIANMVATGFTTHRPEIILDRREAIAAALAKATVGSTVLLIGKGTDPFIMGPKGTKTPWSDAVVAQEEIDKLLSI